MQLIQLAIASALIIRKTSGPLEDNSKCGSLILIFGSSHPKLSWPFSGQGQTYRVCLACGARRQFNPRTCKMQGKFYYNVPKKGAHSIKALRVPITRSSALDKL